ncbi:signal peptide peptidase SppA [Candidatus Woesearchaeota archaeon]|nr:signal peptide peptidase SppA [Candidatus Woesearchaeota archaeon]
MKKVVPAKSRVKPILLTLAAVLFVIFVLGPITLALFDGSKTGNVAIIPITGPITGDGSSSLGQSTTSSQGIVDFIQQANDNSNVKVIVLEINSPGGSAVASDEIASAVKKSEKPVIAVIREVGASGGYWIASATKHIIANRMSITGSIGVISSYLEFSGLMEKYGVNYERLVSGKYKDSGTPFKTLTEQERTLLQQKMDKIHTFFINEVAVNRNMDAAKVRELATGEFFLGVEALDVGLVDELGDMSTAEDYIQKTYGLESVETVRYEKKAGLFDLLTGVFSDFSFQVGEGIGSSLRPQQNYPLLLR